MSYLLSQEDINLLFKILGLNDPEKKHSATEEILASLGLATSEDGQFHLLDIETLSPEKQRSLPRRIQEAFKRILRDLHEMNVAQEILKDLLREKSAAAAARNDSNEKLSDELLRVYNERDKAEIELSATKDKLHTLQEQLRDLRERAFHLNDDKTVMEALLRENGINIPNPEGTLPVEDT